MINRRYFDKLKFKMRRNTILDEKLLPTEKTQNASSIDRLNLTKNELNSTVNRFISKEDYREIMLKNSHQPKTLRDKDQSSKLYALNQSNAFESIYMSPDRSKHVTNIKKLKDSLNATISNIQKLKKSRSRSKSFEGDIYDRTSYVNLKMIPDSNLFLSTQENNIEDNKEVEKEVQNLLHMYHTNSDGIKKMNNKYKFDLYNVIDREKTFTKYSIKKNIERSERELIKKALKQSFYNNTMSNINKTDRNNESNILNTTNIERNRTFVSNYKSSPIKIIKDEEYFDNPFSSYKTLKVNKQIVENIQELLTKKQVKEYLSKIDKIDEFKEKLKYMKDVKITNSIKVFENRKNAVKENTDIQIPTNEASTMIQAVFFDLLRN